MPHLQHSHLLLAVYGVKGLDQVLGPGHHHHPDVGDVSGGGGGGDGGSGGGGGGGGTHPLVLGPAEVEPDMLPGPEGGRWPKYMFVLSIFSYTHEFV